MPEQDLDRIDARLAVDFDGDRGFVRDEERTDYFLRERADVDQCRDLVVPSAEVDLREIDRAHRRISQRERREARICDLLFPRRER